LATIALVVHPGRQAAARLAKATSEWLASQGHQVRIPDTRPDALPGGWPDPADAQGLDLAVSLGGDGTMLRTVELACPAGVPVMGVNLGRLGYLTEVEATDLEAALKRFLNGDYLLEERMTLQVDVEVAGSSPEARSRTRLALNEVALEKSVSGHTIHLAVAIAGRPFITYAADGLIVATPTGSTAYNLSARGPIVSPCLRALVLTPVSPHMLFDRPLVLEPNQSVRLELLADRPAVLVVDGVHHGHLAPGDAVSSRAGPQPACLVTFRDRDFYAILKAKFGLTSQVGSSQVGSSQVGSSQVGGFPIGTER